MYPSLTADTSLRQLKTTADVCGAHEGGVETSLSVSVHHQNEFDLFSDIGPEVAAVCTGNVFVFLLDGNITNVTALTN